MTPAERIERMLRNGVLSEAQAAQLRDSIGLGTTPSPHPLASGRATPVFCCLQVEMGKR